MPEIRRAVGAVTPRPAATTLVLRDGDAGLEVLMVRRSPNASFMPGAYVFPGGAVDAADGSADALAAIDEDPAALRERIGGAARLGDGAAAYAVAALRECFEECGLWLGGEVESSCLATLRSRLHGGEPLAALARDAGLALGTRSLVPFSRWVTPLGMPKRFDTVFFVARAPSAQVPSVDAGETTTLAWVLPSRAMAEHKSGGFAMEFATVTTVRSLQAFEAGPVQALLDHAAARADLAPLHPRLKLDADGAIRGVLLPGQPGYAEAAGEGS